MINAVILQPFPFEKPERLVQLFEKNDKLNLPFWAVSVPNYYSWREQSRSFQQLGEWRPESLNLTSNGDPERVQAASITSNFIPMLGLHMMAGRNFTREEDSPGKNQVAILSRRLWMNRFAGDPRILGQPIELSGAKYTVVGIAPDTLATPGITDVWIPLAADLTRELRKDHRTAVVGRLKDGVSLQQAQAEMNGIAQRLAQQYPDDDKDWGIQTATLLDSVLSANVRTGLILLFCAVGCVLLIACANVASLLLARSTVREREMAIRASLGAARRRIVRQLLTESVLISVLGAGGGFVVAAWVVKALRLALDSTLPRAENIAIDWTVLLFTMTIAVATGILFGIIPSLHASRTGVAEAMKQSGRGSASKSRMLLRNIFVVAEIGLATVLLVASSLFVLSFVRTQKVNAGFRPDHLLTAQLTLPRSKYRTQPQAWQFCRRLVEALTVSPGIVSAAGSSGPPFTGDGTGSPLKPLGPSALAPGEMVQADWRIVTPSFFHTIEAPLLQGRDFNEADLPESDLVAILNEDLARRLWPHETAVGRYLSFHGKAYRVAGVVANVRNNDLRSAPSDTIYMSATQQLWINMNVVLRTAADPNLAVPLLRHKLKEIDPQLPMFNVTTIEEAMRLSNAEPRLNAILLAAFGSVALLLGAIGIYAVMAYAVNQRRTEFGIRLALGASPFEVMSLVLRQGALVTSAGVALGMSAAYAGTRVLSSLLFQTNARDPWMFAAVCVVVSMAAMLATAIPARRALQADPATILRAE